MTEGKKAVALKYEAEKDKAPMKEDEALVEILSKLDIYEEIPVELYKAVAEILVFVYQVKGKIRG